MQTREKARFVNGDDRERNEELFGVLTAISIVSKRLAKRLMALEHSQIESAKGARINEPGQSRPIRK
mgnify:CR=1 FL=1